MKSIIKLCLVLTTATVFTSLPASAQVVAPSWDLPCSYGTNINSTNYAGKVVVLNFFATWCGPCCAEIPSLIALQQKYGPDGLQVVGVSIDDSPDGIHPPTALLNSFGISYGINYPLVMDAPAYIVDGFYGSIEYGPGGSIEYIPNTFIIDRHNHIVQTFIGEQTYATYQSAVLPLIYANLTVSLCVTNSQACLTWPVTQAAFAVQSTTNLCHGVWTNETATIQTNGASQCIKVSAGRSQKFFRLKIQ